MTKKQKNVLNRIIIAIVLLIVITVFKTIVPVPGYVEFILYLIPYFVIGHDILRKSIKNISHGQVFDENFLMAVATIGAMCLGEYLEGSAVMVFYQIGELFQSIAVGKSRKNIAALMDIRPDYANIEVDGKYLIFIRKRIALQVWQEVPQQANIARTRRSFSLSDIFPFPSWKYALLSRYTLKTPIEICPRKSSSGTELISS